MAYQTTSPYNLRYPLGDEEMNIPEDIKFLAQDTNTAMINLVNNNLITSATATIAPPTAPPDTCSASVNNGVLTLVYPRSISDPNKLGTTGNQNLNGSLAITGTLNVTGLITNTATP